MSSPRAAVRLSIVSAGSSSTVADCAVYFRNPADGHAGVVVLATTSPLSGGTISRRSGNVVIGCAPPQCFGPSSLAAFVHGKLTVPRRDDRDALNVRASHLRFADFSGVTK